MARDQLQPGSFLPRRKSPGYEVGQYAELPGYKTPSILTGDIYRPDLLLQTPNECLYIVELTVGFESNLQKNSQRREGKYAQLIREQREHFKSVKFVNISALAFLQRSVRHSWKYLMISALNTITKNTLLNE